MQSIYKPKKSIFSSLFRASHSQPLPQFSILTFIKQVWKSQGFMCGVHKKTSFMNHWASLSSYSTAINKVLLSFFLLLLPQEHKFLCVHLGAIRGYFHTRCCCCCCMHIDSDWLNCCFICNVNNVVDATLCDSFSLSALFCTRWVRLMS